MTGVRIGFADAADAGMLAQLFAGGFQPQVSQLMIYGCDGAAEYIRMQLRRHPVAAESIYLAAKAAVVAIGGAELRRTSNGLFLNYIAVDPQYGGRGVGTQLLREGILRSGVASGTIGLDVLTDNAQALNWYRRLGFTRRGGAVFLEIQGDGRRPRGPVYTSGLAPADLCHERFGFSGFRLHLGARSFAVGRIGSRWFRLTDEQAAASAEVAAALAELDPPRRIFAIVPECETAAKVLARTWRMEANLEQVMEALEHDRENSYTAV